VLQDERTLPNSDVRSTVAVPTLPENITWKVSLIVLNPKRPYFSFLLDHFKSHCGVTDRMCGLCGKGFTTIPVWKRHQKSCEKAASSNKVVTAKGFLDAVTAQRPA
jgi:hypothetical protein